MSEQEQQYNDVGAQQEQCGSLFAALAKAQGMMGGALKDSDNPFFKSKYADLAAVMEAIRPAFAATGLGFIQVIHDSEKSACVETIIIHSSGQSFKCGRCSVPVNKSDAQGYGSAITYAKRYSLQAAVGVPSVDDDGNAAARVKETKAPTILPATGAWESLSADHQELLTALSMDVILLLAKGKNAEALALIDEYRIADALLTNEERIALATRFDSVQRASLKRAAAAKRAAAKPTYAQLEERMRAAKSPEERTKIAAESAHLPQDQGADLIELAMSLTREEQPA